MTGHRTFPLNEEATSSGGNLYRPIRADSKNLHIYAAARSMEVRVRTPHHLLAPPTAAMPVPAAAAESTTTLDAEYDETASCVADLQST